MTREIIPITSEEQWLTECRAPDLTSTMTPGLFGVGYCTPFELYHAKKSGLHVPFDETDRVKKGKFLEPYAAQMVADDLGAVVVRKIDWYARIPGERMGSSFDYELEFADGELVLLELKAVDHFIHKNSWVKNDDEAPPHIEIQIQHQFECGDKWKRGVIAAFTGIYDYTPYWRERDTTMGAALRAKVALFWLNITEGHEPKPDYVKDGDVLDLLFSEVSDEAEDRTKDDELNAEASKFLRLKDEEKLVEKDLKECKNKIHHLLASAGAANTLDFSLKAGWTKGSAGKIVTQEMVGTRIGEKAGYRQMLVHRIDSNSKGKEEKL